MNEANIYNTTWDKPFFAPPDFLFGIAWGILYPIIFVTFAYVFYLALKGKIPKVIALPFALNLLFNFLFTPIQFGLQNLILATADILLVVATLIYAMKAIWPYKKWVSYAQIPYLLWGLFATILQISITVINV